MRRPSGPVPIVTEDDDRKTRSPDEEGPEDPRITAPPNQENGRYHDDRGDAPPSRIRDSWPTGAPWWLNVLHWAWNHGVVSWLFRRALPVVLSLGVAGLAVYALVIGYRDWRKSEADWRKAETENQSALNTRVSAVESAVRDLKNAVISESQQSRELLREISEKLGKKR